MKDKTEIIKRAIILLCLSDRCALEKEVIGGRVYSKEEKEQQRKVILNWLQQKGYIDELTKEERGIFLKEITGSVDVNILRKQLQYESIEPMLWSLGLLKALSSYDDFVLTDFHPYLAIGRKHSLDRLARNCKCVSEKDLFRYKEMAMLWYWRCMDYQHKVFAEKNLVNIVDSIFGAEYAELLLAIPQFHVEENDFIVNRKPVGALNENEWNKLVTISEYRYYAFEWIYGNERWDEVTISL